MSAIPWVGQDIVEFIWGGFSVNNATLNRFFALHFVLPFVLAALALMHLISLHDSAGSNNPLGVSGNYDRLPFAPYFIFKDLITIFLFILVLAGLVFYMPNYLGDSENYVMANPMQTPPAIVPEWYLLPFYAILRSIPNKLLGVIAMFSAILILLAMPFTDLSRSRGIQFRPLSKIAFFIFLGNFLILMQLGAKHVESPFIEFGQISTVIYFSYFLILVPVLSLIENSIIETNNMIFNLNKRSYSTSRPKSKTLWQRFIIGLKLGWNLPSLPTSVKDFLFICVNIIIVCFSLTLLYIAVKQISFDPLFCDAPNAKTIMDKLYESTKLAGDGGQTLNREEYIEFLRTEIRRCEVLTNWLQEQIRAQGKDFVTGSTRLSLPERIVLLEEQRQEMQERLFNIGIGDGVSR